MPKQKKYALIWWLDSAYKDIVDLLVLPRNNREVNSIASMKWRDNKRKKTTNARAKVLAISENRDELENIIVDSRGVINDDSNKIFSTDILQERQEIAQQEKICKSIRKSNKRQIEEKIKKDHPIFDKDNSYTKPTEEEHPNDNRFYSENIHHKKQIISHTLTSQSYLFPNGSNILESITYDKSDDQHNPKNNLQEPFENSTHTRNYSSEWKKPVDANSLNQFYNNAESRFCEDYPITKVSQNHYISPIKQSDYTLMELGNVSHQSCMKSLQSKSKTSNNNNLEISRVKPIKTQNIARRNFTESEKRLRKTTSESSSESTKSIKEYSMQSSSETSMLDSSDESQSSDKQDFNTAARSLARLIPFKITKRDIEFLEFLLAAIRHSYEYEAKADRNNKKIFEIPAHMLKPGDNLVEISTNSGFYLSREKIAYIELKLTTENQECDWKKLVRETLLEVYGESITNYSATGKRGVRPAISPILFKALFNWATEKAGNLITRKAYIQCINKYASNKRKYRKKYEKSRKRRRVENMYKH